MGVKESLTPSNPPLVAQRGRDPVTGDENYPFW